MFIDSHCHLDAPALNQRQADVFMAAKEVGVENYVVPGVSPDGWDGIARLAAERGDVYPAFGIHPLFAHRCDELLLHRLRSLAVGAFAIGEIGLDYVIEAVPREIQQASLRAQLRLAVEAGLPVILHCRHAFKDLLGVLREEEVQRVGGVMHAFSGSPELARECSTLGLAIGVAGTVTYRNAVRPVDLVRNVPLENLLLETDAPDLTPEPYRGMVNEPAFLTEVARKVAEIKGVSLAEVAAATTANAMRVFRIR